VKRLVEIASICSGNSISAKDRSGKYSAAKAAGRHFVSTRDVGFDGLINHVTDVAIPPKDQSNFKLAPKGSTLVCSEGGSAGRKVGLLKEDVHYGNKLFAITGDKNILPEMIFYFCQTDSFVEQFQDKKTGLIGGVSLSKFKTIEMPVPPLEEQQRIVAVLDEAFEGLALARTHAEANLKNARELFDNFATRIFSQILKEHGQTTLGEVCEFIKDGTHQTPTYFDSGFIFLSAKNVKDGRLDWEDLKYIDETQHFAMQKRLAPRLGDLLIRKNGAGYGAAALVDRDVIFDVYVSIAVLRPKNGILPEYLLQFANSSFAQSQFKDRIKGQGVPNLHLQEIKQVKLPVPKDISIQHDIAGRLQTALEVVRVVETTYQNKLQDLADLRQSLLQKAFSGELA
jgi:type I restriction enzyme S subunit